MERAFYGEDAEVVTPASRAELADVIRGAETDGRLVLPAGEGAHAAAADPAPPGALIVSTAAFAAVEEYEPDDFTIGVGAGMTLATLRETLRGHRQEIPVDWTGGGTVGGLTARAPAVPRQGRYGPLATFVLGVHGMRGGGRPFRAGGMVVKNVAGYQVAKFLVGSLGAAGFLLRVNFKLRPEPARRSLDLSFFDDAAAAWSWASDLRASGLEPAALAVVDGGPFDPLARSGLPAPDGRVAVVWIFEGSGATVAWQRREAERLRDGRDVEHFTSDGEEAARCLEALAGFGETDGDVPDDEGAVCLAVLPSALSGTVAAVREAFGTMDAARHGIVGDPSTGLLTVRWSAPVDAVGDPVAALRDVLKAREGAGRVLYLPPAVRKRFRHELRGDPNATLTDTVLRAFDPNKVFRRRRGGPSAGNAP